MKRRNSFAIVVGALLAIAGAANAENQFDSRPTTSRATSDQSDGDYYTNVSGNRVHRPTFSVEQPSGATAQCGDGSYSFSQHQRGTCSHHGGVARWL